LPPSLVKIGEWKSEIAGPISNVALLAGQGQGLLGVYISFVSLSDSSTR